MLATSSRTLKIARHNQRYANGGRHPPPFGYLFDG
jgi:hypothetical protein